MVESYAYVMGFSYEEFQELELERRSKVCELCQGKGEPFLPSLRVVLSI